MSAVAFEILDVKSANGKNALHSSQDKDGV